MSDPIKMKNFSLTRFQLFEKAVKVSFPGDVNVLVGANNSGKTTVLMGLNLFQDCFGYCLKANRKNGKGGKWEIKATTRGPDEMSYLPISQPGDLWPQGNMKGKITLGAEFDNGGKLSFTIEYQFNRFSIKPSVSGIDDVDDFVKRFGGIRLVPVFSSLLPREEFQVEPARLERLRSQRHGEIVRNLLYVLKKEEPTRWKLLQDLLQRLYPDVNLDVFYDEELARQQRSAQIESDYKDSILKKKRDVIVAGSGLHQAIQILASILQPGGSLFLLDEPDAHLHARLQGQFIEILNELAHKEGIQFLLATHSPHILRAPGASLLICASSQVVPLSEDPEHLEVLENVGALDRSELVPLIQTRKVVFLESSEDRRFLTAFAEKYFGAKTAEEILRKVCILYTHQEPVAAGVLRYARQIRELLQTDEFLALPNYDGPAFLIIGDRDYRSDTDVRRAVRETKKKARSTSSGLEVDLVIWGRTEFENYLLSSAAIYSWVKANLSTSEQTKEWKDAITEFKEFIKQQIEEQRDSITERVAAHIQDSDRRLNLQSALKIARERLDREWGNGIPWVDAKTILSATRTWLKSRRLPSKLPPEQIIQHMKEVPKDVKNALNRLKRFAGSTKAPARKKTAKKKKTIR